MVEDNFFDSPHGGSPADSLVVATPNASWTLLESMIDADTILAESVDSLSEDDDGLSMEEQRLETVSEHLRELERAAELLAATQDDFEPTAPPPRKRRFPYVALGVLYVLTLTSILTFKKYQRAAAPPKRTERIAPPPPPPRYEAPLDDVLDSLSDTYSDFERTIRSAKDQLAALVNDTHVARRVLCSVGLGAAGLAVGVPYVPGITDNLVVGIAAAALPFFSSNKDD